MDRGCHPSAQAYIGFLEEDMSDMIRKGYWLVLPYELVKHLPDLRISPIGVVPQRERRPRPIVDYTFSGVNDETIKAAPPEAMQFGHALTRVLHAVFRAPTTHGPVYMLKLDLSDGFYRVRVRPDNMPTLGVAFPTLPGESPLVAFPSSLPMGWTESPPYFCGVTETIMDITEAAKNSNWSPPEHPLESVAASAPATDSNLTLTVPYLSTAGHDDPHVVPTTRRRHPRRGQPLYHADVYVDDEILAAQGSAATLNRYKRQLLHVNDHVFRPNDKSDQHRAEPISIKKLKKGDACWSTRKEILGWIVDSIKGTIELAPRRRQRLQTILNNVRSAKRIGLKQCQQLIGELRSMSIALPGSAGLMSGLQASLSQSKDNNRVYLNRDTRYQLQLWRRMAKNVCDRPTRLAELFPTTPGHHIGACDAAKSGFGGVLFPNDDNAHPPIAWRVPLPPDLQQRVVSDDNPTGTLTNSDLELAATILQEDVWSSITDIRERTVHTLSDNTPAVFWRAKGSISRHGPAARLLALASLRQRHLRHVPRLHYLPGSRNTLADMASRQFHRTTDQLTQQFNELAPQAQSWQWRDPQAHVLSDVISCLRRRALAPQSPPTALPPRHQSGNTVGSRSLPTSESKTHSSVASPTKSKFYGFSPSVSAMDDSAVVVNASQASTYVTKSFTSRRRLPTWGPLTHASLCMAP